VSHEHLSPRRKIGVAFARARLAVFDGQIYGVCETLVVEISEQRIESSELGVSDGIVYGAIYIVHDNGDAARRKKLADAVVDGGRSSRAGENNRVEVFRAETEQRSVQGVLENDIDVIERREDPLSRGGRLISNPEKSSQETPSASSSGLHSGVTI
jgi:hypothetical protein